MIKVSSIATKELERLISTTTMDSDKFLRLAIPPTWPGEGDFGIVIDYQNPDDIVIYSNSDTILLLIDPSLTDNLSNSILDFKAANSESTFTLDIH